MFLAARACMFVASWPPLGNYFLVLRGVPELSRAWVTEGMPWITGGGCLQSLSSLDHRVGVCFWWCRAGAGARCGLWRTWCSKALV